MDRDFKRKRSQDRREWGTILGALLLILCQLYRVSGQELWVAEVLEDGFSDAETQMQVEAMAGEVTGQGEDNETSKSDGQGVQEAPELVLHAKGAVLMDGYTGRVLYGKNASTVMPMASTTKIMTCIVALEYGNPDDLVEVSAYAASMPDVQLGINKGEYYRLGDLLYSLMLESHNDSAVAIAEHIAAGQMAGAGQTVRKEQAGEEAGKKDTAAGLAADNVEAAEKNAAERTVEESKALVSSFAALMNQKAEEIGCENTFFMTPNGLDASMMLEDEKGNQKEQVHSTTAEDLASIMRYCLSQSGKSQDFVELTQTRDVAITDETGKRSFSCTNHNRYLDMKDGAISGKTGFTGNAGYCYVGAVNQNGVYLIVALLACGWPPSKNLKWQDMNTLVDYGLENYSCMQVKELQGESMDYLVQAYNENGKITGMENIRTEISFEPFTLLMKTGETLSWNWYLDAREAERGETVGSCRIMIGGQLCKEFPVLVSQRENYN